MPGLDFFCALCRDVYKRLAPFTTPDRRRAAGVCPSCAARVLGRNPS